MARSLALACLILALGVSGASALPPVFVAGDLDSALGLAKEQGKITLVYLFKEYESQVSGAQRVEGVQYRTERSPLSDRLEATMFTNPVVLETFEQMVCVGVSVRDDLSVFNRLGLKAVYPTFAWVDTDETVLATLGACFEPAVYALVTAQAHEIKSLRARTDLNDAQRERLGTLFYDVGRYDRAAEALAPLVRQGIEAPHVWYLYAFALRATGELNDSAAVLAQVFDGCTARNPTRAEAEAIRFGPATEYDPVVLERDGEFLAILYNLGTSPLLIPTLDALRGAVAAEPADTAEALAAAKAFYQGENWPRAAALYARASEGPLRGRDREEAVARAGIAALFAGEAETARRAFERYLEEDLDGRHRPEVLFYAGSLYLGTSIVRKPAGGYEVTEQAGYQRAADLLVTLVAEYPDDEFVTHAKHLLIEYFDRKVQERLGPRAADERPDTGKGADTYRPGR